MRYKLTIWLIVAGVLAALFAGAAWFLTIWNTKSNCYAVDTTNTARQMIENRIASTDPNVHLTNLYSASPPESEPLFGATIYAGRLSNGNVGIWSTFLDIRNYNMYLSSENVYAASVSGDRLPSGALNERIKSYKETDRVFKCANTGGH